MNQAWIQILILGQRQRDLSRWMRGLKRKSRTKLMLLECVVQGFCLLPDEDDDDDDPFLLAEEAKAAPARPFRVEESPELPEPDFDPEEASKELTAVFTPEPPAELPELPVFDPDEPRREVTADFTLELVELPPELPDFCPDEDPRREPTAAFTLLELLELPPDEEDLEPRAEDTADLILEAVFLTLLAEELLLEEELLLLELELRLELPLLLLVLLWASMPATSRSKHSRRKGSLILIYGRRQGWLSQLMPADCCVAATL